MKPTRKVREAVLTTCLYCGGSFLPYEGAGAKFCSNSHRTLASRKRREATISAISETTGMKAEDAAALVRSAGMRNCTRWLRQQGFQYDERARCWAWQPVEQGGNLMDEQRPHGSNIPHVRKDHPMESIERGQGG